MTKPQVVASTAPAKPPAQPFGTQIVLPAAVEKIVEASKPSVVSAATTPEKPVAPKAKPVEPPKSVPASQPSTIAVVAKEAAPKTELAVKPIAVAEVAPKKPATLESEKPIAVEPKLVAPRPTPPLEARGESKQVEKPTAKPAPATTESKPTKTAPGLLSEEKIVGKVPTLKAEKEEEIQPATPEVAAPPPRPAIPPMYVVMISPELAPAAKVGGLGDVVYGLARELEIRGNSVEIILPKYNNMRYDHVWGLTKVHENLWVPWYGGAINTSVWFGFVHGRKCFFIDPHSNDNFFNRGVYYGQNDDIMRFGFFCRAALEFMLKTG